MINNTLATLGTCEMCHKPMKSTDYLETTLARLIGANSYSCKTCLLASMPVKIDRPERKARCYGGAVNLGGLMEKRADGVKCIICGEVGDKEDIKVIRIKDGALEGEIPYCKKCAREYNI